MILQIGRQSPKSNKGFTFIELMLVTIVIAVLALSATPLFREPFREIRLKNTSHDLVQLIRYLRAKSIAERRLCRLNFNSSEGRFWAVAEADVPAGAGEGSFEPIAGRWGRTFKVPEGISIEPGAEFITFYPDGRIDKVQINLGDEKGQGTQIDTGKVFGYVQVEE